MCGETLFFLATTIAVTGHKSRLCVLGFNPNFIFIRFHFIFFMHGGLLDNNETLFTGSHVIREGKIRFKCFTIGNLKLWSTISGGFIYNK